MSSNSDILQELTQDWLQNPLGNCNPASDYKKINRIGEGTYGYVYRAEHRVTKEIVALKRIILHHEESEGFPLTSIREIKTLKRCQHPNVVKFLEVVVGQSRDAVFLLFEYCEHDLSILLRNYDRPFRESEIKRLTIQLLSAVDFLHKQWIVHRDIKLSNLLYNSKGVLKLADFGLARTIGYPSTEPLTPTVVTLWYRAPEVLLGAGQYSFPIDLWSVGCVFGELLLGEAILQSNTELEQIYVIFKLLGSPNERIWPEITSYPLIQSNTINLPTIIKRFPYNTIKEKLPFLGNEGIEFLQQLFTYRPSLRITAHDALRHSYFTTSPYPKDEDLMPTFPSFHDQMMKEDEAKKETASGTKAFTVAAAAVSGTISIPKKRKFVG